MNLRQRFHNWLNSRFQFIIRNEEDLQERYTASFSHAGLTIGGGLLFFFIVLLGLALATSILRFWLNPAYIEQKNRAKIAQLTQAVDSLEQQATQQKNFISLLQSIIAGKEPPNSTAIEGQENDYESIQHSPLPSVEQAIENKDALALQDEFESTHFSSFSSSNKTTNDLYSLIFHSPVNGIVTMPFNKESSHYGVDIVAQERAPIQCVADGTVVLSSWTAETGWVIMVQHACELVSVYKHNAALLKKVGSFVRAGEAIAIMGNSGKLSTGPHLHFELWHEGIPINPAHFIAL